MNRFEPHFNGPDYQPELDFVRLSGQIQRVKEALETWRWWSLGDLAQVTGDPEASISAQIRHLRKNRFGSHVIEKRRRGDRSSGLFEYRMVK